MEQTSIFDIWDRPKLPETCQRSVDFHYENPHYYILFKRFATEASNAGAVNFGAGAVAERMRWYSAIEKPQDEEYKVNNNLRALYARLFDFERSQRGLEPFFRSRESGYDRLTEQELRNMVRVVQL